MVALAPLAFWDGRLTASANLDRDEALLREGGPAVRVAILADRTVSVGVAQRPPDPIFGRAQSRGLPLVRRGSGGTGLLHLPGDLVWSVVLPRGHPLVGDDFACAYPRLGQGVVDALRSAGVAGTWSDPLGLSDRFCLLGARGSVLTVGGKAVGGAAQHLTRSALLHQGMLAMSVDRVLLADLFDVSPATLEQRSAAVAEHSSVSPDVLGMELLHDLERLVATNGD